MQNSSERWSGAGSRLREASIRLATLGIVLWGLGPWLTTAPFDRTTAAASEEAGTLPWTVEFDERSPLVATIVTSDDRIDVGHAFAFRAHASGGRPPYAFEWRDDLDHLYQGSSYSVTLPESGLYTTTLYVLDSVGDSATLERTFQVVEPPRLSLNSSRASVDVGLAFALQLSVTGGAEPYELAWQVGSNESEGVVHNLSENLTTVSVSVPTPGPVWVNASVVDCLGVRSNTTAEVALAEPTLEWEIDPSSVDAEVGVDLSVRANLTGGSAPYRWVEQSSENGSPFSEYNGTLNQSGPAEWSFAPPVSGVVETRLAATDTAGAEAAGNLTAIVHPTVRAAFSAPNTTFVVNSTVPLVAVISGGWGPFEYTVGVSDGATIVGDEDADGTFAVQVEATAVGGQSATLAVEDALNQTATASFAWFVEALPSAPVPPGPTTSPGNSTVDSDATLSVAGDPAVIALTGISVAGALGMALLRLRRRKQRLERPTIDASKAIPWLESLGRSAESLDREAVYLLGEEDGFSVAQVDAAAEHWVRQGRLVEGREADGHETVSWTDPPETSTLPADDTGAHP